jgi:predicted nucleic acid-binding Zn ribbon protein
MKAKRLISRTNFVLKGSGWYNDLYSSSAGKKDAGGESPAEGASESKSDSKTDSKDSGKKAAKKSDGGGSKKKTKGQAAA